MAKPFNHTTGHLQDLGPLSPGTAANCSLTFNGGFEAMAIMINSILCLSLQASKHHPTCELASGSCRVDLWVCGYVEASLDIN